MCTVSTPRDHTGANPRVAAAVVALVAFGDLTRRQAATVLPKWRHAAQLGAEDTEAVLRRLGGTTPSAPILDDGGWLGGSCIR